jgi:hypothetical protein
MSNTDPAKIDGTKVAFKVSKIHEFGFFCFFVFLLVELIVFHYKCAYFEGDKYVITKLYSKFTHLTLVMLQCSTIDD